MDVGGEYGGYAADITRTVPANGKFTPRQREIYDIVLGAQNAALAAIKPGAVLYGGKGSLQQIVTDYINTHGHDKEGRTLGRYYPHGVSHHIGLDVHDPGDRNRPLEPGMVVTVEPGIYIPGRKSRRAHRGRRARHQGRLPTADRAPAAHGRRNRKNHGRSAHAALRRSLDTPASEPLASIIVYVPAWLSGRARVS